MMNGQTFKNEKSFFDKSPIAILYFIIAILYFVLVVSCTTQKKITAAPKQNSIEVAAHVLIENPQLSTANIGISIYDADEKKMLYDFNGGKYFIPASNTKIATCYAAMKYLGDSLVGLNIIELGDTLFLKSTADPTLLHSDFPDQPVIDFLKTQTKALIYIGSTWKETALGSGWAWDDYQDYYSAERSPLPIYGNTVTISGNKKNIQIEPSYFSKYFTIYSNDTASFVRKVNRNLTANIFKVTEFGNEADNIYVPFITSDSLSFLLLNDTIHKNITALSYGWTAFPRANRVYYIHSQPTDSLLKIMMHRSDNFYAEQSLLMVSNETLGIMNDEKIIDTILHSDFKDIPQKPRWADGSGLSRYNLFTPQDLVWILDKMRIEFSWNRITTIFSASDEGSLSGYYKNFPGKIFAKSGTLSNNLALSGYVITQKNKTLIFSVMVGNHMDGNTDIRKSIEIFLTRVITEN